MHDFTPQHGPPFDSEDQRAKRLRDDISEFRASEKHKKRRPRIFFFEAGQRIIICTHGFLKETSTPDSQIERAIKTRADYFARKPRFRILRGWGIGS